jgi:hypothetical protein
MAGDMKAQRGRTIVGCSLRLQHPAIPGSDVFEYLVQYEHALFMLPWIVPSQEAARPRPRRLSPTSC